MDIRENIVRFLYRSDLEKLAGAGVELQEQAHQQGRFLPTHESLTHLFELDSQLMDLIFNLAGYERVDEHGYTFGTDYISSVTERNRTDAIREARWMTHTDVQAKLAVSTWTDFGFGQSVDVEIEAATDEFQVSVEGAQDVWAEFWTAQRNAPILKSRVLHKLSDELLISGELIFTFWTDTASGFETAKTTIRRIDSEDITEVITVPDDSDVPLYYVYPTSIVVSGRTYEAIWYPDYAATDAQLALVEIPSNAIDANELRPHTKVVAMLVAINALNGAPQVKLRGWPNFKQAYQWFRAYKNALGDVMAKNRAIAMFVDKITQKGGSRAREALVNRLTSSLASSNDTLERNPPPIPGSTWIENEAATRSRMPLGTAAGDDRQSTMLVLGQGAAGTQTPLGWMGRSDAWQNRSVAEMTVVPWNEAVQRYQSLWADVLSDIVYIILLSSGVISATDAIKVRITLETPIGTTFSDIAALIGSVSGALTAGADVGQADTALSELFKLALTKIGVRNLADIFGAEDEEENPADATTGTMNEIVSRVMENWQNGHTSSDKVLAFVLSELLEHS